MIFNDFYGDILITDPTKYGYEFDDSQSYIDNHFALLNFSGIKRHLRYNKSTIVDCLLDKFPDDSYVLCEDFSSNINKVVEIVDDKVQYTTTDYDHNRVRRLVRQYDKFKHLDQNLKDLVNQWKVDIYFPEHKVAVCVNSYENSVNYYIKNNDFVYDRTNILANEHDIRVINVFEDHFYDKHKLTVLLDIITHACRQTSKRIYARDTKVLIDTKAVNWKWFFEQNNIQCYRNAKTAFVLVAKKDLPKVGIQKGQPVMSYTVGTAHFGKGKYDAEIARGACLLGYSVVGGASKLWSSIIEYYDTHKLDNSPGQINSIVYYSDSNYYDGKSVKLLPGTSFITTTNGFWNYWCKDFIMKNREPMRHHDIVARTWALKKAVKANGDEVPDINDVLYSDMAFEVWNAGTKTYLWTRGQIENTV